MKGLEAEVKESVRAYFKDCFPTEAEDKPERSCEASEESCPQEPLVSKADTQESRL
jgi:phosphatidylinositol phospholipase C beta